MLSNKAIKCHCDTSVCKRAFLFPMALINYRGQTLVNISGLPNIINFNETGNMSFFQGTIRLVYTKYFSGLYPARPQGDQANTFLRNFANHVCAD